MSQFFNKSMAILIGFGCITILYGSYYFFQTNLLVSPPTFGLILSNLVIVGVSIIILLMLSMKKILSNHSFGMLFISLLLYNFGLYINMKIGLELSPTVDSIYNNEIQENEYFIDEAWSLVKKRMISDGDNSLLGRSLENITIDSLRFFYSNMDSKTQGSQLISLSLKIQKQANILLKEDYNSRLQSLHYSATMQSAYNTGRVNSPVSDLNLTDITSIVRPAEFKLDSYLKNKVGPISIILIFCIVILYGYSNVVKYFGVFSNVSNKTMGMASIIILMTALILIKIFNVSIGGELIKISFVLLLIIFVADTMPSFFAYEKRPKFMSQKFARSQIQLISSLFWVLLFLSISIIIFDFGLIFVLFISLLIFLLFSSAHTNSTILLIPVFTIPIFSFLNAPFIIEHKLLITVILSLILLSYFLFLILKNKAKINDGKINYLLSVFSVILLTFLVIPLIAFVLEDKPHVLNRILFFNDPFDVNLAFLESAKTWWDQSSNYWQSLLGIYDARWLGQAITGFEAVPKIRYDFMYNAAIESEGIWVGLMLLGLFTILIGYMVSNLSFQMTLLENIKKRDSDNPIQNGLIFCYGINMAVLSMFSAQFLIAVAGNLQLFPFTGINLIWVSEGSAPSLIFFGFIIASIMSYEYSEHIYEQRETKWKNQ